MSVFGVGSWLAGGRQDGGRLFFSQTSFVLLLRLSFSVIRLCFYPAIIFSCTPLRLSTSMRPSLGCPIWATCPMPMSLSETFAWSRRSQQYEGKDCWLSIYLIIGVAEIRNFGLSTLFTGSWCFHWWCILLAAANRLLLPQYQSQPLPATPFLKQGPLSEVEESPTNVSPDTWSLPNSSCPPSSSWATSSDLHSHKPCISYSLIYPAYSTFPQKQIFLTPLIVFIDKIVSFWVNIITIDMLIGIIDTMNSNRVIVFTQFYIIE